MPLTLPDGTEMSDALASLLFAELDHGLEATGPGGTFQPYLRCVTDGIAETVALSHTGVGGETEALFQEARHLIGVRQPDLAALVYDGYFTYRGGKVGAVYVDGYEREQTESVRLFQRYAPGTRFKKAQKIGKAGFLGLLQEPPAPVE